MNHYNEFMAGFFVFAPFFHFCMPPLLSCIFCLCVSAWVYLIFMRAILHFTVCPFICPSPMFGHSFSSVSLNAYCVLVDLYVYVVSPSEYNIHILVSFTLRFAVYSSMVYSSLRMCDAQFFSCWWNDSKVFRVCLFQVSLDCIISITWRAAEH